MGSLKNQAETKAEAGKEAQASEKPAEEEPGPSFSSLGFKGF